MRVYASECEENCFSVFTDFLFLLFNFYQNLKTHLLTKTAFFLKFVLFLFFFLSFFFFFLMIWPETSHTCIHIDQLIKSLFWTWRMGECSIQIRRKLLIIFLFFYCSELMEVFRERILFFILKKCC